MNLSSSVVTNFRGFAVLLKDSIIVVLGLSLLVDVQACEMKTNIESELKLKVEIAQGQLDIVRAARYADRVVLAVATYTKSDKDSWTLGAESLFEVTRDLKGSGPKTIIKKAEDIDEILVGCSCARTFNDPNTIPVDVEEEYMVYMSEGEVIRLAGFKRSDCEVPVEEEIKLVSQFLQQEDQMRRYYLSLDD
ncbi:MAG: hypothetical protein AB8G18_17265 [Gammaproteobacteria bacterium]